MFGVKSDRLPIGVATILSLPFGLIGVISLMMEKFRVRGVRRSFWMCEVVIMWMLL
jgi:hypothetical protein